MSIVVFAELVLSLITLLDRELPLYMFDIPNCILKLFLFACFAWSLVQQTAIKARQALLIATMFELITQFILGTVALYNIHFTSTIEQWCLRNAYTENLLVTEEGDFFTQDGLPGEPYQSIDDCEAIMKTRL